MQTLECYVREFEAECNECGQNIVQTPTHHTVKCPRCGKEYQSKRLIVYGDEFTQIDKQTDESMKVD